ncbi:hypothetical protein GWK47_004623 [Chionoecetes opilio]|uniref:Uncharacterized protein n=1 Tax=Chionoecetes opilio TaxID=41210 RepID=A0A8J4YFF3_CHIOP|nr:hypothetical protein GWK47_004623 [Chionoecetes opilio]
MTSTIREGLSTQKTFPKQKVDLIQGISGERETHSKGDTPELPALTTEVIDLLCQHIRTVRARGKKRMRLQEATGKPHEVDVGMGRYPGQQYQEHQRETGKGVEGRWEARPKGPRQLGPIFPLTPQKKVELFQFLSGRLYPLPSQTEQVFSNLDLLVAVD